MAKTVTFAELQENAGEVIDWTRTHGEPVIVESDDKPIPSGLFDWLRGGRWYALPGEIFQ